MRLPSGWVDAPLLDIAQLHDSKRVPLNATERAAMPGMYPYFGANGQVDTVGQYLFEGDFILLAEDGGYFDDSTRSVAYEVTGKFWVNNHAHILSTGGGIPPRYLCWLLNTIDWLPFVSGTTRLKLTQGGMRRIKVALPPLMEQHRIVARLDELIARLARARTELDRIRGLAERLRSRAILSALDGSLSADWRVSNAGLEPTSDDALDAAYLRVAGSLRRKSAVQIEWRPNLEIPPSWRWVSVDQVVVQVQYGSSAKTLVDSSGVPVLRMGNIQRGMIDWTELKYLPHNHHEFPDLVLEDGDLLFNRTNSFELVGKTAVYRSLGRPASFASYLIRLRPSGIQPEFLAAYLNSSIGRAWVEAVASQQVGQANVNGSKLRALGVPLPSSDEQAEIMRRLSGIITRADRLEAEAARARALVDRLEASIFARAFKGELVPQDPSDEPARVLLERIRAQRAEAPKPKAGRRKASS